MKVFRNITAAIESGTKFYKISLQDALDVVKDINIILWNQLYEEGWNALDFENNYWGSDVVDDILYLCVTDGNEIDVDGEMIDPDYAIQELGVDRIKDYLADPTDEIIKRYITPYELAPADIDSIAYTLLGEGYSLEKIIRDARDTTLLDI